jgi:hypothetical protein
MISSSKIILAYRYPCAQGALAALAVYLAKTTPHTAVVFVPHNIHADLDMEAVRRAHPEPDAHLYLLNYSGPTGIFLHICSELFARVWLIDCHKSAFDLVSKLNDVPRNLVLVLDTNRSGCQLALDYVVVSDRFAAPPEMRAFFARVQELESMTSFEWDYNKNTGLLDVLKTFSVEALVHANAQELARKRALVEYYLPKRYRVLLKGAGDVRFIVAACTLDGGDVIIAPDLGRALAELEPLSQMGAVCVIDRNGMVAVSLYSTHASADTRLVSKCYGGNNNGHACASEFVCTTQEWLMSTYRGGGK